MSTKQLAIAQEKLKAINTLSNLIQKVPTTKKDNIAYLIHKIIEADCLNSNHAREIQSFQIEANKDIFMKVKN